jgi:hypothetical protein
MQVELQVWADTLKRERDVYRDKHDCLNAKHQCLRKKVADVQTKMATAVDAQLERYAVQLNDDQ